MEINSYFTFFTFQDPRINRYLWIPFTGFVFIVFSFILRVIWGSIADKFVGVPIMNRIEYYLQYIQDGIPFFVDWVMNHPVQASFVWFFLSLSIIIILVFVQTRDIKDVYPEKAGNGYDTRIVIHNETGYHLSDYTIRVVRIDNIKCSYQLGSKQVTYTMGKASAQRSVPELRHGKTIVVKLHPLVKWIMDINKFEDSKKTIGEHSLEIIFHAFDKKNNVVDLYIFADVEIKENEQSKIVIVKEVAT